MPGLSTSRPSSTARWQARSWRGITVRMGLTIYKLLTALRWRSPNVPNKFAVGIFGDSLQSIPQRFWIDIQLRGCLSQRHSGVSLFRSCVGTFDIRPNVVDHCRRFLGAAEGEES